MRRARDRQGRTTPRERARCPARLQQTRRTAARRRDTRAHQLEVGTRREGCTVCVRGPRCTAVTCEPVCPRAKCRPKRWPPVGDGDTPAAALRVFATRFVVLARPVGGNVAGLPMNNADAYIFLHKLGLGSCTTIGPRLLFPNSSCLERGRRRVARGEESLYINIKSTVGARGGPFVFCRERHEKRVFSSQSVGKLYFLLKIRPRRATGSPRRADRHRGAREGLDTY